MRPEPGRAIAYLDYSGQELGLAAAYSGDRNMQRAYSSGDFYLAAAKELRIAPVDATKRHPAREVAKTVCLGLNYGMTMFGLAFRLNIGFAEADELLAKHRAAYPVFWAYSDAMVDTAMWHGRLVSSFGWQYLVSEHTNPRALRNFQMQAGGGDMLRLAVIGLRAAGITIIATVHDAVLIEASAQDIDGHVVAAKEVMRAASMVVTGGFPLRVDDRIVRPGQRYSDARGVPMWNRIARWSRGLGSTDDYSKAIGPIESKKGKEGKEGKKGKKGESLRGGRNQSQEPKILPTQENNTVGAH
jgi:DNA polymerase I-like protein with 3'-5' exonuclease and polymerase domains